MYNLGNRLIDDEGNVVYFTNALMELLYRGEIPSNILYPKDDPDVAMFNKNSYENYDDVYYSFPERLETLEERKDFWFYPDSYDEIDLNEYFIKLCKTPIEIQRVNEELELYKQKGFEKFLRFCIFLSDRIKENGWVIGCGRGSSCASYLLFLIKIHLVDSIKYGLNIREFLK